MTLPRSHQPNPDTTPLHRASEAGDLLTVKQMLTQGYSANTPDRDGKTPLHWVSIAEVAQVLIEHGGDVNAVNHGGYRPLHSASRRGCLKLVRLLLNHGTLGTAGTEVNVTAGHYRLTPLHLAVDNGHEDVAKLLLANGADPNSPDWVGMTPIDVAIERGSERMASFLNPTARTTGGEFPTMRILSIG